LLNAGGAAARPAGRLPRFCRAGDFPPPRDDL